MKRFITLLILTSLQAASADVPAEQKPEVDHLLEYVNNTDCIMIRNGSEHTGKDALSHIKNKYKYFEDEIKTTEDFIKYSATKSTMSGKYYTVRCPQKEEIHTQDWLLEELAAFRRNPVEKSVKTPPSPQPSP